MTSIYYNYQNPWVCCFLVQIKAFVHLILAGLTNLNNKAKPKWILVVVVKYRHRAIVLLPASQLVLWWPTHGHLCAGCLHKTAAYAFKSHSRPVPPYPPPRLTITELLFYVFFTFIVRKGNCKRMALGLTCEVGKRQRTFHILSGSVLSVWSKLESVLAGQPGANSKVQIVRCRKSDGSRIVGEPAVIVVTHLGGKSHMKEMEMLIVSFRGVSRVH